VKNKFTKEKAANPAGKAHHELPKIVESSAFIRRRLIVCTMCNYRKRGRAYEKQKAEKSPVVFIHGNSPLCGNHENVPLPQRSISFR